jgi:putative membrane protein
MNSRSQLHLLLSWFAVVLVASSFGPSDRFTWLLEVGPIFVGAPLLVWSRERFPLTSLLYALIGVHAAILALGGAYTYAEVPFGFWLQEVFSMARNPYDRIGHFAQGFIPAILAREILLRRTPLERGRWLSLLGVSVWLGLSALYELFEWWTAVASGEAAEAFLGTQGDVWDTQWDMFLAATGACVALLLLSRVHDRQLEKVAGNDLD